MNKLQEQLILSKVKPQAIIIKLLPFSNFDKFLKQFMFSLVCDQSIFGCQKCIWCKKIINNCYYDLIQFDAKVSLKKDDIINLQNKFYQQGLETKNIKFCVIKNIEFANKQTLNSLLKFLEELPKNSYLLLTTTNYDLILPTIKSRCMSFALLKDNELWTTFLKSHQLIDEAIRIFEKCFFDYQTADKNFELFNKCYELITNLCTKNNLKFTNQLIKFFKTIDYVEIYLFLEILKHKLKPKNAIKIVTWQKQLQTKPNKFLIINNIKNIIQTIDNENNCSSNISPV